ncbi:hypothetical protein Csa_023816, partial [Cucumis sativus]
TFGTQHCFGVTCRSQMQSLCHSKHFGLREKRFGYFIDVISLIVFGQLKMMEFI